MDKFIKFISYVKKEEKSRLIIKIALGVLLFVIACIVYFGKTNDDMEYLQVDTPTAIEEKQQDENQPSNKNKADQIQIYVDITGAVVKPSVIELADGSRVFEAIEKAGGITSEGDTSQINLAAKLSDGTKIYVPTKSELQKLRQNQVQSIEHAGTNTTPSNTLNQDILYSTGQTANSNLININTADSNTLQQLTGVGPSTAEKIINYRNSNGNFEKIEDLKNVSGIGDKTFQKFRDKICIN